MIGDAIFVIGIKQNAPAAMSEQDGREHPSG
jgi:hypothetical protein